MEKCTRPWIICDIDGIVSDARHRAYYLTDDPAETNWREYTMISHFDPPIVRMCRMIRALSATANISFVTGRAEYGRQITKDWIIRHIKIGHFELIMRPEGDLATAEKFKLRIFSDHFIANGRFIWCIFEDDGRVVKMYRSLGLLVLQPEDRRAGK